ncbi:MAG: CD225/dispanin family protein, partial [Muribaculaceae bacterium]|nr:CD225/dispanin family protein [Muribaculaceae bacterium]
PPVPPTPPEPATPPPTPDEEWAKRLKLDFDPEKVKESTPPPVPEGPEYNNQPAPQQPTPQQPVPGDPYGPYQQELEPMPPTYMVWSVLALVLCCFVPAIVAIIYSAQVSSKYYAKDYEGAKRCSDRAQIWIIVSIVLGVIGMALYLPLTLLSPS